MPRYRLKHPESADINLQKEVKAVKVILNSNQLFSHFPSWLYLAIVDKKVRLGSKNRVNVTFLIGADTKPATVGDYILNTHRRSDTFEEHLDTLPSSVFHSLYEMIDENDYPDEKE